MLNDHGNYIIDHGKIMEKSWNFVFEFLWEPCRDLFQTWIETRCQCPVSSGITVYETFHCGILCLS